MSTPAPRLAATLLDQSRGAATSVISDSLGRLPAIVGLRPFHTGARLLGTALTVKVREGDNLYVHQALELVRFGDVLVVDGGGDVSRALVGEIMMTLARSRGAAGFVIDGAIRDVAAFAEADFPCYARAVIPRGPSKNGPGQINVPVSIGGSVVSPGDVVVGDQDGVVTFAPEVAPALLEAIKAQEAAEAEVLESIRTGRYDGRYARPSPP